MAALFDSRCVCVSWCCSGPVKVPRSDEVEDSSVYSDTDLCGFDEHKSVILHLLSQLKLGMDLTKVCFLHIVATFSILASQSQHKGYSSVVRCRNLEGHRSMYRSASASEDNS